MSEKTRGGIRLSSYMQYGWIEPDIDQSSLPYWEGVNNNKLLLPTCHQCEKMWFPPLPGCPYCASDNWSWSEASGIGKVYSWVVIERALHSAFTKDVPYTVLTVKLNEGPKIFGRMVDSSKKPYDGMPVKAEFYKTNNHTLLGFSIM